MARRKAGEQRDSPFHRFLVRPNHGARIMIASAAKHQALMAAVQKQGFDDKRLEVLQEFLAKDALSCAQAAQVVQQFKFSDGQVQAAIAVHPRLSDPANFELVLGALTFGLDKDKVRKALKLK